MFGKVKVVGKVVSVVENLDEVLKVVKAVVCGVEAFTQSLKESDNGTDKG